MKQTKRHSGTYCCPECCVEYELFSEERLQCDQCKGPLYKGSVEDFDEDEVEDGETPGF